MEEQALLRAAPSFWSKAKCIAVSSRGASGGLATLWDSTKADLVSFSSNTHWIFTKIIHKESNLRICIFNFYSPIALSEKQVC